MKQILSEIKKCKLCEPHLELGTRPVVSASSNSKVIIIGQAPGTKVHTSGIPWDDSSGKQLRKWMGVTNEEFYNEDIFAIIPMGFCYPGKGKSGDLPPRKECAPKWHQALTDKMSNVELIILIGMYAQKYYLGERSKRTLTETVNHYPVYLPGYFVLPHPSPRNRFWLTKNPWFEKEVVPQLQQRIGLLL